MSTKTPVKRRIYADGWVAGYNAARIDSETNVPKTQQQFYDLNPHDLDTVAMGIALVVLHAADIQTIEATMVTQQKLGVAGRVLRWLHLLCIPPALDDSAVSLTKKKPDSWLYPPAGSRGDNNERIVSTPEVATGSVSTGVHGENDELPF